MKIGLFFGSFNPIHTGHLVIAGFMANYTELDEVWLIVSPHNPLKDKSNLIPISDRFEMARLAIGDTENISVSDVELGLPRPSYTIDTLNYLKKTYQRYEFNLIMGSDNLGSLKKWKDYDLILRDHRIFVYPRLGYENDEFANHTSIVLTPAPLIELSSSFIRQSFKEGKSIRFFVPDSVLEFIGSKNLYR